MLMEQRSISVVHILTSLKGGAAVAASSLNVGLIDQGIHSKLLVNSKRESEIETRTADNLYTADTFDRLKSKSLTVIQQSIVQSTKDLITTFGISRISDSELLEIDSIIHIHSAYNFIKTSQIQELANHGKQIVIHLHDQRFITGGCHHDRGCREFLRECNYCPMVRSPFRKYVIEEKKRINGLLAQKNITFVVPSVYLHGKVREICLRNPNKIRFIPNLPPKGIVRDGADRTRLRESLGISENMFVLGFSAANLDSPYKNFNYFKQVALELSVIFKNKSIAFRVLVVGAGTTLEIEDKVVNIGSVNSCRARELLSAMDLLLVTSSIDNTPNVIIESLLEGTPALGTQVGGIPELFSHLKNWPYLTGDLSEDISTILSLYKRDISRSDIRDISLKAFNRDKIISQYIDLYNSVRDKGI
jgi:glycosyltransferase involved in cell wall biosynthesis